MLVALFYSCVLISCTYEESTKVHIGGTVPPTFRLDGSGHQIDFTVRELSPDNYVPPADQKPDKDIDLWKIVPEAGTPDIAWDWPEITYGKVPPGFRQELPKQGAPPALVEGKTYEAGGAAYGANGGFVLFVIRNAKSVEVPKPGRR